MSFFPLLAGAVTPSDPNALDFIARAGISNPTQQGAINALVLELKAAGLWAKLELIYPFVGGTPTAHAQNLKSATFPITWSGAGLTHNAEGVTSNGTGSGDTGWLSSIATIAALQSFHISAYSRTESVGEANPIAIAGSVSTTGGDSRIGLQLQFGVLQNIGPFNNANLGSFTHNYFGSAQGLFLSQQRTATSANLVVRNGAGLTYVNSPVLLNSRALTVFCRSYEGFANDYFFPGNLAFFTGGAALATATDIPALDLAIGNFQTALSRNVTWQDLYSGGTISNTNALWTVTYARLQTATDPIYSPYKITTHNLQEITDINSSGVPLDGAVDLSGLLNLSTADFSHSPITSIALNGCPELDLLLLTDTKILTVNTTQCSALTGFSVENCLEIQTITSNNLALLSAAIIAFCPVLYSVNLSNCPALTSTDISGCGALISVNFANSGLDSTSVDNVLTQLEIFGASNGTCDLAVLGGVQPSGTGLAAKLTLESRGWSVNTN